MPIRRLFSIIFLFWTWFVSPCAILRAREVIGSKSGIDQMNPDPVVTNPILVIYRPESDGSPCPVTDKVKWDDAPEGFGWYTVPKGQLERTVARDICGNDPLRIWIFCRVNRLDEKHMLSRVLVPIDLDAASEYTPIPKWIADTGESMIVFRSRQYYGVYSEGRLAYWGPVSTGRKGHETPLGTYRIVFRQQRYPGYDPKQFEWFMWLSGDDGNAIHRGPLTGEAASNGCIRMLLQEGLSLYRWDNPELLVHVVEGR